MIKQTWNIGLEERRRILGLHESATKRLYLYNEQSIPNPVQGPGNQNTLLGQDENFVYFVSQPSLSVGADYIYWNKAYFVYASDGETSYQCEITEKDEKGRPINVQVLKDKPLPKVNEDFLFSLTKLGKKDYDYQVGNEITKNSFLEQGVESTGVRNDRSYFAVVYRGNPVTIIIVPEGPRLNWGFQRENVIDFDGLEVGSNTNFDPTTDVFYGKRLGYFSLTLPTLVTSYPVSIGKSQPEKPTETPGKVPTPTPPQPVPLGDKFMDNVSMPSADAILKDPKFIEFKKFVDGNDMSKFIFDIQSSASKCSAGFKEANKSNGKWSEDKATYPDVTVDPQADKNDIGNLNLTKSRAQNLKNFLITNLPKLKDAKFRVIAQGSKGTCGTEEENQKMRRVDLTVTQL